MFFEERRSMIVFGFGKRYRTHSHTHTPALANCLGMDHLSRSLKESLAENCAKISYQPAVLRTKRKI